MTVTSTPSSAHTKSLILEDNHEKSYKKIDGPNKIIQAKYFSNKKLESVDIGESVKEIGHHALVVLQIEN